MNDSLGEIAERQRNAQKALLPALACLVLTAFVIWGIFVGADKYKLPEKPDPYSYNYETHKWERE